MFAAKHYRDRDDIDHIDASKIDNLLSALSSRVPLLNDGTINLGPVAIADSSDDDRLTFDEVAAVCAAKPGQMEAMRPMGSRKAKDGEMVMQKHLSYSPILDLEVIVDRSRLELFVRTHSECLFGDALQISSMMGYTIQEHSISETCAVLTTLLNSGMGYVASKTHKLMGLLPLNRSMVVLNSSSSEAKFYISEVLLELPKTLIKRSKDMHRIFRNKVKKTLSLRLNSDIDTAISLLREHHGEDCWVGTELEKAWRLMAAATPPMFMVSEWWYGDSMIAADFCHPICGGRSVYVATRFFIRDSEVRHIQPGFLLALAECQVLKKSGCLVWDLGGVNMCPLMRYKYDLAGTPVERPEAMYVLSEAWAHGPAPGIMGLRNGTLIEDMSANDLLGVAL